LVPSWSKDTKIGYRTINARSETVSVKPAYRGAWRQRRRCLILADGFFEWQELPSGRGPKVPHWIHMADGLPFGFAGLWEQWDGQAQTLFSCTILTTAANSLVAPIHDRMPVIFGDESAWNSWVDPQVPSADLTTALVSYPPEEMHACAVTTHVNRPANEGPRCIEPIRTTG
jgi:putative SOS response-associated peptidase YedK